MTIPPAPLPIDPLLPRLAAALAERPTLVLTAPTGSGKTTRVPPALVALAAPGAVLVLEPRRVAARAAARRVAAEQGWELGREVGYVVRQASRCGPETRLLYVTEGVLLRRLQGDPLLEGVGAVVLDEVHERHLETDLALGLLAEVRQVREDLRVVAMSATLEAGPLAAFLGDAAVLTGEGRLHPVTIHHLPRPDERPLVTQVVGAARRALADPADDGGDLLVFLPGMAEIRAVADGLAPTAAERDLAVLPLHGALPDAAQDRALAPGAMRKVILATNVAESSLTVPGVTTVIDSGWVKQVEQDRRTGLDRLVRRRISRASAAQRAGRAGRTAPGRALRLWTEGEHHALAERELPEIRRVELAGAVLQLRAWGCADPAAFGWFEAPPPAALARADALLRRLGALDARGLTAVGRQLAALPVHPRLGRLLTAAAAAGCLRQGAELAALLSERDPVRSGPGGGAREADPAALHVGSDLLHRRELVFGRRAGGRGEASARGAGLDPRAARAVQDSAELLFSQAQAALGGAAAPGAAAGSPPRGVAREEALLGALLAGFPDRVAARREEGRDRYQLAGGRAARLDPASGAREAPLLIVHRVDDDGRGPEAVIRWATAVTPALLERLAPAALTEEARLAFDDGAERVVAERVRRFDDLVISRQVVPVADRAAAGALLGEAAAREPRRALAVTTEAERLLARILLVAAARPEAGLPGDGAAELAAVARELAVGRIAFEELRREDLAGALLARLSHAQRTLVASEAPERWTVPSGRAIPIRYVAGEAPVLAVKLQELFGQRETPRIAGGRVALVVHLLSPAGRPVQVTQDLESFWDSGYAAVRRELRGRYPKHPWPEDPRTAPATAGPRRRR